MKQRVLTLFVLVLLATTTFGQSGFVELPFQTIETFGPFSPGYLTIDLVPLAQAKSKRSYHLLKGVPGSWKGTKQGVIQLHNNQYIFQRIKAGEITDEEYKDFQAESHWSATDRQLSSTPIRCFVYVVTGADEQGRFQVLVDSNNNLDVSDEQPFEPATYSSMFNSPEAGTIRPIQFERYLNGKIVKAAAKLAVWRSADEIKISFPLYAQATFPGSGERIAVVATNCANPNFINSVATVLTDSMIQRAKEPGKRVWTRGMSKEGEYLSIN